MCARKRRPADDVERRENALRPSRYLGYDRDQLGVYLMNRGASAIAESQFRRAIWLNPFEPLFREHLALCLLRQGRQAEALSVVMEGLSAFPDSPRLARVKRLIEGTAEGPDRARGCDDGRMP